MPVILSWVPAAEIRRVLDGIADEAGRVAAFAACCRINVLYMVMRAGSGHLGSSFSAADIVSFLHLVELDRPFDGGDLYFSSKGHDVPGLYAAMIGLQALPESYLHRLRRMNGLPGHPDVRTPHIPLNTGSLGMGVSKAKGLVLGNRLTGRSQRVYVLTGDGELQEGQNWEALAGAVQARMGELTVIVDYNKIQSDTWVRDVSDLGDLTSKFTAFGWAALRCDGHDPAALASAFARRRADYPDQPAVIIADTIKGAGCATFAATSMPPGERRYRFHSGAPPPALYQQAHADLVAAADSLLTRYQLPSLQLAIDLPHSSGSSSAVAIPIAETKPVRLPECYGELLCAVAERDDRVVALDADLLVDTGLAEFSRRFGDRFIECGIAEQDMVSMAGGLAARGLLPFVHSFSCFLHARPNEQIYNNATEGRKVIYTGSLAGLLPAGPGHSHQAVRDVSALAAIPGLAIIEPANPAQLSAAVDYCLAGADSVYLRLASVPCPASVLSLPAGPFVPGTGSVVRPGGLITAIGAGPVVLGELLAAADLLAAGGVKLTVINLPWHNRIDQAWLTEVAGSSRVVFVVEHQYTLAGQASLVGRALAEASIAGRPGFVGIGLTELPRCGNSDEVLDAHGLSAARLATAITTAVRGLGLLPSPRPPS